MGIWSPAAFDALFLEKCKLLLEAALRNPRRRGGPTSFEEFVVGLDVHDQSSLRAFEVLLQETTMRRPRKPAASTSNSTAGSTASPSASTSRRTRDDEDIVTLLRHRHEPLISFPNDSSDDSSDDSVLDLRPPPRGSSRLRPTGVPADSHREHGTDDASPSTQLRQREVDDLFGLLEPLPSFSQVLADLSSSTPTSQSSSSSISTAGSSFRPASSSSSAFPDLPTFEELWTILLDDPFPSASVTSFSSFLDCLNVTSLFNTPLRSPDMNALLADLTVRDPAIPIRVRNAVRRRVRAERGQRRAVGSASPAPRSIFATASDDERSDLDRLLRRPRPQITAQEVSPSGQGGDEPLREGIWRASFIEHLDDGSEREVPIDLARLGTEAEAEAEATSFAEFARRRRAATRGREGEGTNEGMQVDGQEAAVVGTPTITVTDASSTPATSQAASPPPAGAADQPGACPSPPDAAAAAAGPARQRTSADIAEALFRSQRRIAPLPSPSASSLASDPAPGNSRPGVLRRETGTGSESTSSLRAVFDALQRARERREERERWAAEEGSGDDEEEVW
ncbi:hypothetical protein JCM21900_001617 [Sporobolomyces salmonicolor]